jgi:hypothetical protein
MKNLLTETPEKMVLRVVDEKDQLEQVRSCEFVGMDMANMGMDMANMGTNGLNCLLLHYKIGNN